MTLQEYNAKYWRGINGEWNHSMQTLINGWVCLLRYFTCPKDSDCYNDIKNFLTDWDSLSVEEQEYCTEKYEIETYIKPLFNKI